MLPFLSTGQKLTSLIIPQVNDLPSRELVPGDIVQLLVGDKVLPLAANLLHLWALRATRSV